MRKDKLNTNLELTFSNIIMSLSRKMIDLAYDQVLGTFGMYIINKLT